MRRMEKLSTGADVERELGTNQDVKSHLSYRMVVAPALEGMIQSKEDKSFHLLMIVDRMHDPRVANMYTRSDESTSLHIYGKYARRMGEEDSHRFQP